MDYIVGLTDERSPRISKRDLDLNVVGARIQKIRKKFKLTQIKFADYLNTSHSTISAYETGKTLILTTFAYQICLKYGVSMDWLCGKRKR